MFDFRKDYGKPEGIAYKKRNRLFHLVRYFVQMDEKMDKQKEIAKDLKEAMKESIKWEEVYEMDLENHKANQKKMRELHKEMNRIKPLIKQHQQSLIDYTKQHFNKKYPKDKVEDCNNLNKIAAIDLCSDEGWDDFNFEMRTYWECAF